MRGAAATDGEVHGDEDAPAADAGGGGEDDGHGGDEGDPEVGGVERVEEALGGGGDVVERR